ncbi:MAG: ribosome-associated translation inhibitor RaiA [Acidobacteria bacterium]|jgi:putative sigma-54 modulation protein|nr:MAG: ribosome-associated translation inhibitor RaiA [Acidobacteriota bacterium]
MNVEYTGRQYEIAPDIRKEVEIGLAKIRKILGDKFEAKVILVVEKRRHKAEITISPRNGPIVGLAEAGDMKAAVNEALEHLQKQALKYKTRWRTKKRKAHKKWNGESSQEEVTAAVEVAQLTAVPMVVHKFPAVAKTTDVHLVHSDEAVARHPMTLEEAIKEAHFRDRDVFVFRDPKGRVMILHRTRDGKMELIEAP